MVQIVSRIVSVVGTHWQLSNLLGEVTIRVPIDDDYLIAIVKRIGVIVRKPRINPTSLIPNAVVVHLDIGARLEIHSALVAPFRASENTAQDTVQLKSSDFQCRDPQSSR